ncbi:putative ATP-grasp-modified RiPP [Amycolatopsis sp. GM8]|uniref:putative ATP-grasp-modified RiPP n=1 Tax=Amycolatopsis sp. GM8 TaxID=2896530 RepID=UPI001F20D85A|nr:putative ATP-grasp-modified RiPP [Amycolatopsis sp. GM8]
MVTTEANQGYRFIAEPIAGESAQFPLSRGATASDESASPAGLRPWGLRRMAAPSKSSRVPAPLAAEYDHLRQMRVDVMGRPLIEMGDPTAVTTGSTDGSDGDPSEDYHND